MTGPSSAARAQAARTAFWIGVGLVVLYDFVSGGNEVFVANRLQAFDPALLLLLSTAIAAIIFNCLQVRQPGQFARLVRTDLRMVVLLNLATALTWVSFFVALKYAEPAIVATVNVALAPLVTILLARWIRPGSSVLGIERLAAAGILTLLVASMYVSAIGQSGVRSVLPALSVLGVGASIVCGVGIALTPMCSKRLYDVGWRASQVMAVRFWALIALATVAVVLEGPRQHDPSGVVGVGVAALITAVVGTVVSLYILQLGIERLEPVTLALLFSVGPMFTLGLQSFDPRLHFSIASAAIVCLAEVLVGCSVVVRARTERRRPVA